MKTVLAILFAASLIAAQTCSTNFITAASAGGTCPSTRSCQTTSYCCGSCSGSSGDCYAYTCGITCQNSPCSSCPANFDALPSDETGSRPSTGSCPATRPHKTTEGCCGACLTSSGTVMAYDCGTYCTTDGGDGCQSTALGTTSSSSPSASTLSEPDSTSSPSDGGTSSPASSPPPPPPTTSSSTSSACANLGITDHCCSDGLGNAEYGCPIATSCGKGQCIPAGSFLCIDGPTDYVCSAGTSCGRGVCVPAGSQLCGTSGTTTCPAGTTCCGVTAETKNTDMTCSNIGNTCPIDRLSSVSYISVPYVYTGLSEENSSMVIIIGAAAGAVVVLGVIGAIICCLKQKQKQTTTSNIVINNIAATPGDHL